MFLNLKSESSRFLQVYRDGLSKEGQLLGRARKIRSGIRSSEEGLSAAFSVEECSDKLDQLSDPP